MKNDLVKNILFVVIIIAFSIGFSFLVEYFYFNRNVRNINSINKFDIVEKKDIEEKNDWLVTTSEDAYIVLKNNLDNKYVNKLTFNYKTDNNMEWYYKTNKSKDKVYNKSGHIITKAVRLLDQDVDTIKIGFKDKNIKVNSFEINNSIYLNISRMIFITLTLTSIVIIIYYNKFFRENIDKAFLFIVLVSGIIMFVVSPKTINTYLDDRTHLMNSHSLFNDDDVKVSKSTMVEEATISSNKNMFTTQEEQIELYKSLNKLGREKIRIQVNNYSPKFSKIIYIPFNIGIKIGDFLNLSFIFTMLLARLLNFLIYVLIMYFAIKISMSMKNVIFLLSLAVSRVFCATQFTYDTNIVALLLLSFALFFRIIEDKKINKKLLMLFIVCVVVGSLSKAIYAPILLLILLLDKSKFDNAKQAKRIKISVIVLTLLMLSTFVLPVLLGSAGSDVRGGNTSIYGQISYILTNPFAFSKTLIKFMVQNIGRFTLGQEMFVNVAYLGNTITSISETLYLAYLILLLKVVFSTKLDDKVFSNKKRLWFGIFAIIFLIIIPVSLYLSFTPIGMTTINGMQARYFYPLIPLFLIIMIPNKLKDKNILSTKYYKFLIVIIPYIILTITNFYIMYKSVGF